MSSALDWYQPVCGLRFSSSTAAPLKRIQIYGQRCSGTNFVAKLIERNLGNAAFTENFGFKHWLVPESIQFDDDVLVLVIARNVFEWLGSLHRNPWHLRPEIKALPFPQFIRAEWDSIWDNDFWGVDASHRSFGQPIIEERNPDTDACFDNAIVMRNAKLGNWIGLQDRAACVALLDYDLVRRAPKMILENLRAVCGFELLGPYVPIDRYKGIGPERFEVRAYPRPNADDEAFIISSLDRETEASFGFHYPQVETAECGALRSQYHNEHIVENRRA